MFTVLWMTPHGSEELYSAATVVKIPAVELKDGVDPTKLDCHGRKHLAILRFDGRDFERTLIDCGNVFVMNGNGKTVASYQFPIERQTSFTSNPQMGQGSVNASTLQPN